MNTRQQFLLIITLLQTTAFALERDKKTSIFAFLKKSKTTFTGVIHDDITIQESCSLQKVGGIFTLNVEGDISESTDISCKVLNIQGSVKTLTKGNMLTFFVQGSCKAGGINVHKEANLLGDCSLTCSVFEHLTVNGYCKCLLLNTKVKRLFVKSKETDKRDTATNAFPCVTLSGPETTVDMIIFDGSKGVVYLEQGAQATCIINGAIVNR